MSELDVLFVNPNAKKDNYGTLTSEFAGLEPPVWCVIKAGYLRNKGFDVDIVDAEFENLSPRETAKIINNKNPLLVDIVVMGISPSASSTPKMGAVEETVDELYNINPDLNIMLSGLHPSALPELTLKQKGVSFVCQGEGFRTIHNLIKNMKSGGSNFKINGLWYKKDDVLKPNPPMPIIQNIDVLSFMAWDLLPMDKYRSHNWHCLHDLDSRTPYAAVYTSFGCPFNCTYCNIHCMYNGKPSIRYRSPERVVDELKFLYDKYKVKNIKILDELFVLNENRVIDICNRIIKHGLDLNIWAYARVDTVNKKILNKLKQAGFNWVAYGIEAGSKKARESVNKGNFSKENIENTIKMTREAGVYVMGNFMFGLPGDSMETMQETLNFAKEVNCEYVNFYSVMAYPGSKLFEDVEKSGVRLPDTWLGYGQLSKETVPLPNKYLSSEQILAFRDNAFNSYFTDPKYLSMVEEKFGVDARVHITEMTKVKLKRKILGD